MRDTITYGEVKNFPPKEEFLRDIAQIIWSEKFIIRKLMKKKKSDVTDHDVDDMVQEIALSLLNSSSKIDRDTFVSNQAYREKIYKNKMIDKHRSFVEKNKVEARTIASSQHSGLEDEKNNEVSNSNPVHRVITVDVDSKLDIEKFFRKLFSEIDNKVRAKLIKSASAEKMKLILKRRMEGFTIKEIGAELGITESAVGLITSKLRELFPQYEEVWKIVKTPTHERDDDGGSLGVDVYKKRLERVLFDLKNSSFPLNQKERVGQLVIEWYLDSSLQSVSLREYLLSKGFKLNLHQLSEVRNIIENLAGAPINFSLIIRNSV